MAQRHTVLVVDDEPAVLKSMQNLLRMDYRVLGTTLASEGIRILEIEDVHVIVSDQRMPEMTGVEFLARVKGEHPEAVRLLCTGYADIRTVIAAINQGSVYRYVTKPCDPEELITIIREAAERYELIVERKRLMAELQQKNKELEAANASLTRSDALKACFIQVASHELRTPLAILTGLCGLATRTGGLTSPHRDWLTRIQKNADRMSRLVEQITNMLAVGNFDRGLQVERCDLAALLAQCAEDVHPFADMRRQVLALDLASDLGAIEADRAKLHDTFNHLLLNAIKFTPDQGRITLLGRREGAQVRLCISDTGIGIDAVSLPQIFSPFFTGFDVSKHSSGMFEYGRKGLGLGLSVVKAFIEMRLPEKVTPRPIAIALDSATRTHDRAANN